MAVKFTIRFRLGKKKTKGSTRGVARWDAIGPPFTPAAPLLDCDIEAAVSVFHSEP